jgi:CBS domain-containing protein
MTFETMRAADVMSRTLVTIEPDESPLMAWELMRRGDLHHLPVIDADSRVVGVLKREDVASHWSGGPAEQSSVWVGRLLDTQPCPQATQDMPLAAVACLMIDSDADVVAVTGPTGALEGLITATDVLKAVAGRAAPPQAAADVRGGLFRLQPVLPHS